MIHLAEAEDPENTKPKMKEYFKFWKTLYPDDAYSNILSRDKSYRTSRHVIRFIYQTFHEKKSCGWRHVDNARKPAFDIDAYWSVVAKVEDGYLELIVSSAGNLEKFVVDPPQKTISCQAPYWAIVNRKSQLSRATNEKIK